MAIHNINDVIEYSPEVQTAMADDSPIVALESTLIAHGLPEPDNLNTAFAMQSAIRERGAVPAIIALMGGKIKIGLSDSEIAQLADSNNHVMKVNRADIPYCLLNKLMGATTVSATSFCAAKVGIRIFATGGMGGVHRGVETTFDISSDLTEIAKTPIIVICSGVKAILDIPKTLEYLETYSVPVVGYKTKTFPMFYSADSRFTLTQSVDSPQSAAALVRQHLSFQSSGMMIANPIPQEHSLSVHQVDYWIGKAIDDCEQKNVRGKAVTPYLLTKLSSLSDGATLKANIALLINNAAVAAEIACAL